MFKKSDYGYSSSHEFLKSTKAVIVPNFDNKFSDNGKDFFDSVTEFSSFIYSTNGVILNF